MVKSTRHSKTKREPVTIDLEAEAVKGDPGVTDAQAGSAGAEHTPTVGDDAAARAESTPEEPSAPEGEETSTSDKQEAAAETGSGPDEVFMTEDGPEEEPGRTAEDRAYDESRAARPSTGGGFGRALAAGVAGGVIALVLAGGLQWAGILPAPGARGADPAVETVRQDIAALQNELSQLRQTAPLGPSTEELEQALAGPRREIGELRDTVTALQAASPTEGIADFGALEQRLSEMESRLASLAETAGGAGENGLAERLAEIETRMDNLAQAAEGARQAAGANAQRLEEITGQVAELSEQVASEDEGPRLALIVAASALKSAVERGAPFASELETYSALAPDATGVEPLEQYAQAGIPTQAELAEEAPEVASRIAANASASPPDAGFLDRLMASARSAVTVRPVGEVEGDTPEAIAARMEAAVQRGDYTQALDEYDALPPDAKETASDFAEKLRARQAADDVLEKALSGALQPA